MRTPARTRIAAAVAVAIGAVGVYSAPSQAQPAGGPEATGCYKIIEGEAGLSRHFDVKTGVDMEATFPHDADFGDPTGLHYHTEVIDGYSRTATNDADAYVSVLINNAAGSDCSDVRYRLRVLDEQSRLVTEVILPGAATDRITWNTRFNYPFSEGRHAYVSVTTETLQGRVLDTAPDAAPGHKVNLDSGGATSGFK